MTIHAAGRSEQALEAVMEGLTAAIGDSERTHGISSDLIMCFLRDRGAEAADHMLSAILPFREDIIGVGLDSTEIGYPPDLGQRAHGQRDALVPQPPHQRGILHGPDADSLDAVAGVMGADTADRLGPRPGPATTCSRPWTWCGAGSRNVTPSRAARPWRSISYVYR